MKCLFCLKPVPIKRIYSFTKYCSELCNKRAWYIKHNPNTKSYLIKNPLFWKTETGIGFKWERYAAKLLKAKHLKFNKFGSDLDWNGKKIDVKVCNLYQRKFKRGKAVISKQAGVWVFNRNKQKPVDFFFCIGLIKNKLAKKWLIPADSFQSKGIVVGHKSKYDKYLI